MIVKIERHEISPIIETLNFRYNFLPFTNEVKNKSEK